MTQILVGDTTCSFLSFKGSKKESFKDAIYSYVLHKGVALSYKDMMFGRVRQFYSPKMAVLYSISVTLNKIRNVVYAYSTIKKY